MELVIEVGSVWRDTDLSWEMEGMVATTRIIGSFIDEEGQEFIIHQYTDDKFPDITQREEFSKRYSLQTLPTATSSTPDDRIQVGSEWKEQLGGKRVSVVLGSFTNTQGEKFIVHREKNTGETKIRTEWAFVEFFTELEVPRPKVGDVWRWTNNHGESYEFTIVHGPREYAVNESEIHQDFAIYSEEYGYSSAFESDIMADAEFLGWSPL